MKVKKIKPLIRLLESDDIPQIARHFKDLAGINLRHSMNVI